MIDELAPAGDQPEDRIIWRLDMAAILDVTSDCVGRYIKRGKLPTPDVQLSQKRTGWRLSTLHAAGVKII